MNQLEFHWHDRGFFLFTFPYYYYFILNQIICIKHWFFTWFCVKYSKKRGIIKNP